MKYRALCMGVFCFLGMSLEACMPCFSWRKKNQVVPVGISKERKKKIKELVAAAPEGHFKQMKHKGKLVSQDIRDIKQEAAQVLVKINHDNLYNTTQSIAPTR